MTNVDQTGRVAVATTQSPDDEIRRDDEVRSADPRADGAGEVPAVVLDGVTKRFVRRGGVEVRALDDVSLTIAEGEFVVLLGPSGCGKTTLLRSVAGLEVPDSGTIDICGSRVFSSSGKRRVPPNQRPLNMMFQSYALWPHMTVAQNVAFPLRTRHVSRRQATEQVERILEMIGIAELAQQHPSQLSGGQQQRVALARALVNGDRLILFDEPLSNVDAKVREQLRGELFEMQRRLKFAAMYVTHDQDEAMELADRVVVMERGRIAQCDTPATTYDRPANRYVANFVGAANELVGVVTDVRQLEVDVKTDLGQVTCSTTDSFSIGDSVVVVWRPESGEVTTDVATREGCASFAGTVHASTFSSGRTTVVLDLNGTLARVVQVSRSVPDNGRAAVLRVPLRHLLVFPNVGAVSTEDS